MRFPGKDTGVGGHFPVQGVFPTQKLNPGLLHCRQVLYKTELQEKPIYRVHHVKCRAGGRRVKKAGLKFNIKKTKIMASSPITSRQIEGAKVETVTDFIFLGSKITADGDCSHEIRRHLLLGRKAMISLDGILKSRDITLPTKVCLVKAMIFPVVMYGCESWAIMKAEHHRIDAFKLWCWRRLLRVPWTARRSNQ